MDTFSFQSSPGGLYLIDGKWSGKKKALKKKKKEEDEKREMQRFKLEKNEISRLQLNTHTPYLCGFE